MAWQGFIKKNHAGREEHEARQEQERGKTHRAGLGRTDTLSSLASDGRCEEEGVEVEVSPGGHIPGYPPHH